MYIRCYYSSYFPQWLFENILIFHTCFTPWIPHLLLSLEHTSGQWENRWHRRGLWEHVSPLYTLPVSKLFFFPIQMDNSTWFSQGNLFICAPCPMPNSPLGNCSFHPGYVFEGDGKGGISVGFKLDQVYIKVVFLC